MSTTVALPLPQTESVLVNMTRSVELLRAHPGRDLSHATAYQPYCRGAGIRTSFLDGAAEPFRPFTQERNGGPYTDLVRFADDFYMRVVVDDERRTRAILVPGENWLKISFQLGAAVGQKFSGGLVCRHEQGTAEICFHPPGVDKYETVEDGCWGRAVTLYLSPRRFRLLSESERDKLPPALQRVPEGLLRETLPLNATLARIVADIVNAPYLGSLRHSYVQAKSMELLCEVIHFFAQRSRSPAQEQLLSGRDKRQIDLAREIILESYVDAPSIAVLARRVGLNQRKLKSGFKQRFGITIADFAQTQRLEKAWELLRCGDFAVGQVADQVGYVHAKNFTTAFKRYFGISPKLARRGSPPLSAPAQPVRDCAAPAAPALC